ncbi:unnamed protein product [Urochloa decumbens]|uniref:SHSP domain-containing protein n=1 Tax=Urochloa decumbens TaxID=240449 RepID=A0ABC9B9U1_9POAL
MASVVKPPETPRNATSELSRSAAASSPRHPCLAYKIPLDPSSFPSIHDRVHEPEKSSNNPPSARTLNLISHTMAMAAGYRKNASLASAAAVIASAVMVIALLSHATPAAALVPYGHGLAWDLLDDPFRVLEQSPFSVPASTAPPRASSSGGAPAAGVALARCDWKETPDAHVISVDVPGVRREDVRVEVDEATRVLRVSGERRAEEEAGKAAEDGEVRWHRAERAAGRFWRRFRMPAGADVGRVSARMEDGVLTVIVPKVAGHRGREPRLVTIAGGEEGGGAAAAEVKASKAEM